MRRAPPERLPAILDACARRWSLAIEPPLVDLSESYNYVCGATLHDGTRAVVKVVPVAGDFAAEVAALRCYEGRGAVRLLAHDDGDGAMLLERLEPGTRLSTLDDDAATRAAATVMRELRPAPPAFDFPTVRDWSQGFARLRARFDGATGPLPAALVDRAERLFAELDASSAPPVLLHGDLHHDNILASARAPWLAIDPQGVVGEPAYEVGAFLRNPHDRVLGDGAAARLQRRVDILAGTLGFDRARMLGWSFAQAVLSAWWNVEDFGAHWEHGIACAELFATR